jgi:hypothetical protein
MFRAAIYTNFERSREAGKPAKSLISTTFFARQVDCRGGIFKNSAMR